MDRHEKWEKVPVGYRYTKGEPFRLEGTRGEAKEGIIILKLGFAAGTEYQYFRDKTWFNVEVGDVLSTLGDISRLPVGTTIEKVSVYKKVGDNLWYTVGNTQDIHTMSDQYIYTVIDLHNLTIIGLPKKDS